MNKKIRTLAKKRGGGDRGKMWRHRFKRKNNTLKRNLSLNGWANPTNIQSSALNQFRFKNLCLLRLKPLRTWARDWQRATTTSPAIAVAIQSKPLHRVQTSQDTIKPFLLKGVAFKPYRNTVNARTVRLKTNQIKGLTRGTKTAWKPDTCHLFKQP